MNPLKKYNLFIFLTIFARCLVEVFIPIILYTKGFSIRNILYFLLVNFFFNIILAPFINYLGKKITFKWIICLSAFLFVLMYYSVLKALNVHLIALLYSANTTSYYIAKHNYAMSVLDKSVGGRVGSFMIFTIIASIPAGFIGAILLENLSIFFVLLIVLVIYLLGIIPLLKLDIKNHYHDKLHNIIKKIPPKNILFFAFLQFKTILFFLTPLYIYKYVKDRFEFIGLLGVIVGIASIIFIYFYAKIIDKKKKDYLLLSSILLSIIIFIEIKLATPLILIILSFFEGIATKMYEVSATRDFYLIDKKIDKTCYFLFFEVFNNIVKFLLVLIIYLLNLNLYYALLFLLGGLSISGFIKFQIPKNI